VCQKQLPADASGASAGGFSGWGTWRFSFLNRFAFRPFPPGFIVISLEAGQGAVVKQMEAGK